MCNCFNMSEFESDFESAQIQRLLFIQMYSETKPYLDLASCAALSISFGYEIPGIGFKDPFL